LQEKIKILAIAEKNVYASTASEKIYPDFDSPADRDGVGLFDLMRFDTRAGDRHPAGWNP